MSFLDDDNVEMNFVKGKWQKLRFHTPDSLEPLLRGYFRDVRVTDRSGANLKAVCKGPLPLPKRNTGRHSMRNSTCPIRMNTGTTDMVNWWKI